MNIRDNFSSEITSSFLASPKRNRLICFKRSSLVFKIHCWSVSPCIKCISSILSVGFKVSCISAFSTPDASLALSPPSTSSALSTPAAPFTLFATASSSVLSTPAAPSTLPATASSSALSTPGAPSALSATATSSGVWEFSAALFSLTPGTVESSSLLKGLSAFLQSAISFPVASALNARSSSSSSG